MIGEWLKKLGGMKLVIAGVALGVVLIIVGMTGGTTEHTAQVSHSAEKLSETTQVAQLEKRLTELLMAMDGVSDVNVMIFAADDGRSEYAADTSGTSHENVILGSSSNERLEEVRRTSPDIIGVAVICPGTTESRRADIAMLVSAVFGISASKVYVSG